MYKIIVRGKEFKIELVNNYCSRIWQDTLFPSIIQYETLRASIIPDATNEFIGKKGEEKIAAIKEQADVIKKKNAELKELEKVICETREEIIQEILESNEYEFDKSWWLHRTSTEDMNDFIAALFKVEEGEEPKKKA